MTEHHIWCNNINVYKPSDAAGCSMCDGMNRLYPPIEGDVDGEMLRKKYFPGAEVVWIDKSLTGVTWKRLGYAEE